MRCFEEQENDEDRFLYRLAEANFDVMGPSEYAKNGRAGLYYIFYSLGE